MRFWTTQRYQFLEIFFFEFWLLDEEADKRLCVGSFVHVKKKKCTQSRESVHGL